MKASNRQLQIHFCQISVLEVRIWWTETNVFVKRLKDITNQKSIMPLIVLFSVAFFIGSLSFICLFVCSICLMLDLASCHNSSHLFKFGRISPNCPTSTTALQPNRGQNLPSQLFKSMIQVTSNPEPMIWKLKMARFRGTYLCNLSPLTNAKSVSQQSWAINKGTNYPAGGIGSPAREENKCKIGFSSDFFAFSCSACLKQ